MGAPTMAVTRSRRDTAAVVALLAAAALGWWWSVQMAADMESPAVMDGMHAMPASMGMSFGAFVLAWVAMMAAMMFPAVTPVVRLYAHAARRGTAAPVPVFVGGYLAVWAAVGIPAYLAWDALRDPLMGTEAWVARLAGGVFVVAAAWQLTPLKTVCLHHCRTPMSFFLHLRGDLRRSGVAARAGMQHGAYCLGCCWALMAVLVAMGTMHLGWMLALTAFIAMEKVMPAGDRLGRLLGAALAALGVALLAQPEFLTAIR